MAKNDAVALTLTKFVLPAYDNTNSWCPIATTLVSSSGSSLNAMSVLTGPTDDGTGSQLVVVPTNKNTDTTFNFYIQNVANGGKTWYSS